MSYDLYVYKTPPGCDPEEVFEDEMEIEESGESAEPVDDPTLARWFGEIEEVIGEHASTYRCGGHLSINIPYHYEGAEAKQIFSRLVECLQRACAEGGLTVYDPQEGRAIAPKRDLDAMLHRNDQGSKFVNEISPRPHGSDVKFTVEAKKPWWRFW